MPTRLDLMEGLHRLAIVAKVDAFGEHVHCAKLIEVEYEFLIGRGEAAFEPASGMQHEVGARQHRRQKRLRALISRLRVRDLRGAERAAGAEGHVHPSSKLAC